MEATDLEQPIVALGARVSQISGGCSTNISYQAIHDNSKFCTLRMYKALESGLKTYFAATDDLAAIEAGGDTAGIQRATVLSAVSLPFNSFIQCQYN